MKKILCICVCLLIASITNAQRMGNTASNFANTVVSQQKGEQFLQAVKQQQMDVVKKMINDYWPTVLLVNYKDADGNTPLMLAAENGNFELVRLLGDNGAYVNTTNRNNNTALCIAASHDRIKTIKYLIQHNAHVNYECGLDRARTSPLLNASSASAHPDIIKALVEAGANVNYATPYKHVTPLMKAVQKREMESIKILVEAGADVNAKKDTYKGAGMSVGFFALHNRDLPALKYLVEHGARLDSFFEDGAYVTALDDAEYTYDPEIVEYVKSLGYTSNGFHDPTWD